MKPRTRSIKNLYFRWGEELGLEAIEVAKILEREKLIELTPDREHYRETDKALSIAAPDYEMEIKHVLLMAILPEVKK